MRLRKGGRLSEQFGLQMIDQITIQGDGFGQELMQGLFQVLNHLLLLLLLLLHGRRLKRERESARASENDQRDTCRRLHNLCVKCRDDDDVIALYFPFFTATIEYIVILATTVFVEGEIPSTT